MDQQITLNTDEQSPIIKNKSRIKVTIPVQNIAIDATYKQAHPITPLKSYKSEFLRPKRQLQQQSPFHHKQSFGSAFTNAMQQYQFPLIQSHGPKHKTFEPKYKKKNPSAENSIVYSASPEQNTKIGSVMLNLILAKKLKKLKNANPQGLFQPFKTKSRVLHGFSPKKRFMDKINHQIVFPLLNQNPTFNIHESMDKTLYQESHRPKKPRLPTPPIKKQKHASLQRKIEDDSLQGWDQQDHFETQIYTHL